MTGRPVANVFMHSNPNEVTDTIAIPAVFATNIRLDIVQQVHSTIAKNRRQAQGVRPMAGHTTSAEGWGTGRAVARIPRVGGSGTHRSGQGAFGNMCRGGHMFSPLKIWRRWHQKINLNQKRHALASALAASAVAPLVQARGHRIDGLREVPLVIDSLNVEKTKDLLTILRNHGAGKDLQRVLVSRKIRTGKGKYRNRRYVSRRGPLIVYGDKDVKVKTSAKNIPGVDTCHVSRLNLLQVAPGGHVGRFIIWTKEAFGLLREIFAEKTGYTLLRPLLANADLARIINSDQVQSVVRNPKQTEMLHESRKRNPLANRAVMHRLNPFAKKR